MISDADLARLTAARERLERTTREAEQARAARDELVRELLASGATTAEIADAAGLSGPRVYQIRDARR